MKTYVHLRCRWTLLIMRNVSDKRCRENQNTHFTFRKSRRLWDNVEKCGRARQVTDGNIIRRMHIACCITKATDTRSEYVIIIVFPQQQWLRERATILHYTTLPVLFGLTTRFCLVLKYIFLQSLGTLSDEIAGLFANHAYLHIYSG
jgi:hypothetical protein